MMLLMWPMLATSAKRDNGRRRSCSHQHIPGKEDDCPAVGWGCSQLLGVEIHSHHPTRCHSRVLVAGTLIVGFLSSRGRLERVLATHIQTGDTGEAWLAGLASHCQVREVEHMFNKRPNRRMVRSHPDVLGAPILGRFHALVAPCWVWPPLINQFSKNR